LPTSGQVAGLLKRLSDESPKKLQVGDLSSVPSRIDLFSHAVPAERRFEREAKKFAGTNMERAGKLTMVINPAIGKFLLPTAHQPIRLVKPKRREKRHDGSRSISEAPQSSVATPDLSGK